MKVTLGSKKRPHWTLRHCLRKIKLIDQKKKKLLTTWINKHRLYIAYVIEIKLISIKSSKSQNKCLFHKKKIRPSLLLFSFSIFTLNYKIATLFLVYFLF